MRHFLIAVAAVVATSFAIPALAAEAHFSIFANPALATEAGVSISIGEPGFFGRLDIGGIPLPPVIVPRPVVIERSVPRDRPPIYLRVPAKHRKHWKKYCHRYNACGERVLFVKDSWYKDVYVPHYREKHRDRRHERRDERREERRDDRGKRMKDRHDRGHGWGRDR